MATTMNRLARPALLKAKSAATVPQAHIGTWKNISSRTKTVIAIVTGTATAVGVGSAIAVGGAVSALTELALHPPHFEWTFTDPRNEFDKRSLRRGWQVYKQVCSACHSVQDVRFREMVGVIFTQDEAKREAADFQIIYDYDSKGEPLRRKAKLADAIPSPYLNDKEAEEANNGVKPPDLSSAVYGRHGGFDYVFSLLTGYCDAPAGVNVEDGVYYNPYYYGGLISMAQALYNEIIEYEDGTPATQSQLAKDVVTFLAWCGEPEHDRRKRNALKLGIILGLTALTSFYWKKLKWSPLKTKVIVKNPKV